MHHLLFYDYVPDILQKRDPYRPGHLAAVRELHDRGVILMAGAAGDPIDSAVFVFRCDSPAMVEAFVRDDPYVNAGLVTSWRVKPWNVVVPSA
jgi:hypothetical protein